MRYVLILAALLLPTACAPPSQPRVVTHHAPYTPPYPDLLRGPATPPAAARPRTPHRTDAEKSFYLDQLAILEAYRCKAITQPEALRLGIAHRLDRRRHGSIPEARRSALFHAAADEVVDLASDGSPCLPSALRLVRLIQQDYPATQRAAPPQARPAPAEEARPAPADTGWQPAPPQPRAAPAPPDQIDL